VIFFYLQCTNTQPTLTTQGVPISLHSLDLAEIPGIAMADSFLPFFGLSLGIQQSRKGSGPFPCLGKGELIARISLTVMLQMTTPRFFLILMLEVHTHPSTGYRNSITQAHSC
jgi:hypothetical protein